MNPEVEDVERDGKGDETNCPGHEVLDGVHKGPRHVSHDIPQLKYMHHFNNCISPTATAHRLIQFPLTCSTVFSPTNRTTNSPTNLTENAQAIMNPVAASQNHHAKVKGASLKVRNRNRANVEPEMKKRSGGSRRM